MRSLLSIIFAGLAASVAIGGSLVYGFSGTGVGVITTLLVLFAICGLHVFVMVMLLRRRYSRTRLASACISCGMIVALISVTVMTFAPLAATAAVLCVFSILLCFKSKAGFVKTYVPAISISGAISFVLLLWLLTTTGVRMVETPSSSVIMESLPGADYVDTFLIEPSIENSPEILMVFDGFVFSMQPWWPDAPEPHNYSLSALEPGATFGLWRVHHRSENELILGLDRSFINLRLSLMTDMEGGRPVVLATTIAKYNNWRGKVYFTLVRFGHQIVLSDTMRRMAFYLENEGVERAPDIIDS